jgi:hypothetical protein
MTFTDRTVRAAARAPRTPRPRQRALPDDRRSCRESLRARVALSLASRARCGTRSPSKTRSSSSTCSSTTTPCGFFCHQKLKVGKFEPECVSKMNFYLNAVARQSTAHQRRPGKRRNHPLPTRTDAALHRICFPIAAQQPGNRQRQTLSPHPDRAGGCRARRTRPYTHPPDRTRLTTRHGDQPRGLNPGSR